MKRKTKLFFSLASLCLSVAMLCFGVYSAMSVSYTVNGSVSYEVKDVFVNISTKLYKSTSTTLISEAQQLVKLQEFSSLPTLMPDEIEDTGYNDEHSTYEDKQVSDPGQTTTFTSKTALPINYGAYTEGGDKAYGYYIVIEIENLGTETVHAIADISNIAGVNDSLNSIVQILQDFCDIDGGQTGYLIIGMALNDATKGVQNTFDFTVTIDKGKAPAPTIYGQSSLHEIQVSNTTLAPISVATQTSGQPVDISSDALTLQTSSEYLENAQVEGMGEVYMAKFDLSSEWKNYDSLTLYVKSGQFSYSMDEPTDIDMVIIANGKDYETSQFLDTVSSAQEEAFGAGESPNVLASSYDALLGNAQYGENIGYQMKLDAEIKNSDSITVFVMATNLSEFSIYGLSASEKGELGWDSGNTLSQNLISLKNYEFEEGVLNVYDTNYYGYFYNFKVENWYSGYRSLYMQSNTSVGLMGFIGNYNNGTINADVLTDFNDSFSDSPNANRILPRSKFEMVRAEGSAGNTFVFCIAVVRNIGDMEMTDDLKQQAQGELMGIVNEATINLQLREDVAGSFELSTDKTYYTYSNSGNGGQGVDALPKIYKGLPVSDYKAYVYFGITSNLPNSIKSLYIEGISGFSGSVNINFEAGTVLTSFYLSSIETYDFTFNDTNFVNSDTFANVLSSVIYYQGVIRVKCDDLSEIQSEFLKDTSNFTQPTAVVDGYAIFTHNI